MSHSYTSMSGDDIDPFRPRFHLSPPSGWLNDPHGVIYRDGLYHIFFQANPEGPFWSSRMCWGHATTADFATFRYLDPALRPGHGDEGCWTGSLVAPRSQAPLIFFSSVQGSNPLVTDISVAIGDQDLMDWRKEPEREVVPGAPESFSTIAFRDPFVRPDVNGWEMLVGTGLKGAGGGVFSYRSDDLVSWHFHGLVASGVAGGGSPTGAEEIWECPQLLEVDGRWLLVVSVWRDGFPAEVSYSSGERDPRTGRFVPGTWGRLDEGGEYYAATAFTDSAGRWTLLGWSREGGTRPATGAAAEWAGVLTTPRHVRLRANGSVSLAPALLAESAFTHRWTSRFDLADRAESVVALESRSGRARVRIADLCGVGGLRLREAGTHRTLIELQLDATRVRLVSRVPGGLDAAGHLRERNAVGLPPEDLASGSELTLFIDQSIIELFTGSGVCSTHRFYALGDRGLELVAFTDRDGHFVGEMSFEEYVG